MTADKPVFDRLADRYLGTRSDLQLPFPGEVPVLVWYALGVVLVEVVLLQAYNVAVGRPIAFVDNPLWLLRPVVLVGGAVAVYSLYDSYDRAREHSLLFEYDDLPSPLVPPRLTWGLVGAGIAFTLYNALGILTVSQIYSAGGPARVFRFVVITPFGYVPILAVFLSTYLSIQVYLPLRIRRSDIELDFLDPQNVGGMRPLGELLKQSYYLLMLGLCAYAIATYAPYIIQGALEYEAFDPPGLAVNVLFTSAWAFGVGAMVFGIYVLHRCMAENKRRVLKALNEEARAEFESWDIREIDMADPPTELDRYHERVRHVTNTREYPATFTMWTQLLVGVMLPKALQVALAAI